MSRRKPASKNPNIVGAQAFMVAEGSTAMSERARTCSPPGCVTSARAQGTGGNLGGPRASRTARRGVSDKGIGRGGAREQATGTRSASADTGLGAKRAAVSSRIEALGRVGAREGDRSVLRWDGGVGLATSTCEAGEVARAATLWREGANRDPQEGVINSVSPGRNIRGTRRPVWE